MPNRPDPTEYAAYYAAYVSLVPDGAITEILETQIHNTVSLLKKISEEQASYRYAPGKWSMKQVVGHMADTERIMAYRLLSIARGETVSLPGFDQDLYVANAAFDEQPFADLIDHFAAVRQATLHLLKGLDGNAWMRKGTANEAEMTVRGIAYVIAGHELHHIKVLKEKYLR
ncbi:hypothetical protein BpJC7_13760 [Weizmannia acidilactici]|uniref:DinB-like domain-containing protein n=1 Tax=Weizmannia acidilactici TaxID=2607726 RepID=A0A5J4JDG3_9BACI|nr:DinB family protein [Weizmannia acidilactici]GER67357.1 hypothetical protein BpJC4_18280 [Weizmannia acidilactici]GER70073.1 hypothetical protein BpJC7_13760 [Weizmannia acidilactici]GER74259.1 hypothetical protein BpPP18_23260 [Weizmannia acidilactici]